MAQGLTVIQDLKMENSCIRLYFVVSFAIASLIIPSDCFQHLQPKAKVALFVLGDSLLDPGNNNYINTTTDFQANFLPYGETHFQFGTGRFSDGRLINDFIAEFAGLPLIPPYFQASYYHMDSGVNFASGGGGVLVETHAGLAIDLNTQLGYFKNVEKHLISKLGYKQAKQLLSNAVYLFSCGGNDVLAPSSIFSSFSPEEYVEIIVGNYTGVIKEIYKMGARKFGFVSLGPLGCFPYVRAHQGVDGQCAENVTALSKLYNVALSQKLNQLEKELKGFKYSNFDFFSVASEMIENPSEYGFKEVKRGCCGSGPYTGIYSCGGKRGQDEYDLCKNPGEYLFFDSYHPCERAQRMLAELMWHGDLNVTSPYNLKTLFELDIVAKETNSQDDSCPEPSYVESQC